MKRLLFLLFILIPPAAQARPLFLEPSATVGRLAFEATVFISERRDQYGTPENKYLSEDFPMTLRLGLHRRFDIGFTLQHASHRLITTDGSFSGSDSGRVSPEFKWALRDNISVQGIWHLATGEEDGQELPIAQGGSPEVRLLATVPTAWPICFDAGYLKRGSYNGRLAVQGADLRDIDPGDVADLRLAVLVPLGANFSFSLESIYSHIGEETVDGIGIDGTKGSALDIFGGLSWIYKDVTLGLGVGTGLLDESHTSFAVDRGAGDITGKFLFSYKLQPHKETQ